MGYPVQWEETIRRLSNPPFKGIIFVLGGPDTGKTTFSLALAGRALKGGARVGIVDSDVGQSTFGPPTTIGLVIASELNEDLKVLKPTSLHFVGDNSPRGHMLETLVGVKRMVDKARDMDCNLIVVDTSGLIAHPFGEALKYHKISLISPNHIVALQREKELEPILRSIRTFSRYRIHRLPVPPEVRILSREERIRIRKNAYQRYFANSKVLNLPLKSLALYPTGIDLAGRIELFNLVLGLKDSRGELLGIGILTGYDAERDVVKVFTPVTNARISGLVFGSIRLRNLGQEIGRVAPWQL
ncbi:MAG: Clp1/GlmU family protein [Actinomycetota bacterium]|nr:Clp1/GlmU family protein [Actinomycetota bacterium]